jgi:selenocysteine lyase/cysteine desulfurase
MTVSDRLAERLRPHSAGRYAGQDVFATYYGAPLRLAEDASRFDVSPAWFCWVGIRAATRAGAVRASFHLYNTEADVDAALDALT